MAPAFPVLSLTPSSHTRQAERADAQGLSGWRCGSRAE